LGVGTTTEYNTPQHLLPPTGYEFTSVAANSSGNYFAIAALAPVPAPEPTGVSLLAVGGIATLRRRRVLRAIES
jgi:hypothetical protein